MNNNIFKPHGAFLARYEGRILVQHIEGPWNEQMVAQWAPALAPFAAELEAGGAWAALAVFHRSVLTSPEAFKRMRKAIEYSTRRMKVVAHAVVAATDVEGQLFAKSILEPVYRGLTPIGFFTTQEEAEPWLYHFIDEAQSPLP